MYISLNRVHCTISIEWFEVLQVLHKEMEMFFIKQWWVMFHTEDKSELRIKEIRVIISSKHVIEKYLHSLWASQRVGIASVS